MKARPVRPLAAAVAVLALASLSACDTLKVTSGGASPRPGSTRTVVRTVTATPTPSGSPTTDALADPTGDHTGDPTDGSTGFGSTGAAPSAASLSDRLLTAQEMPPLGTMTWKVAGTVGREPKRLFATCERFGLLSIGAVHVATRTFTPAGMARASAGNLVARFPDAKTAKRAFAVLRSFHDKHCDQQIGDFPRTHVGDIVDLDAGQDALWYLLSGGPVTGHPDDTLFDSQGMVRVGDTISLLEMKLSGQDFDYPAGQEPMVAAVSSAAARLS
ncbi:MAG: hypothetical protein ACXVW2_02645 [Nocardioidaceae bacterium]